MNTQKSTISTSPEIQEIQVGRVARIGLSILDRAADMMTFIQRLALSVVITPPRISDVLASTNQALRTGLRPTVVFSFPFGMSFGLFFESLGSILGLRAIGSVALVPAVMREEGPLSAGIVGAATFGAAFCADIGARRTRGELDAMEMLSIDPHGRLYLPRIIGSTIGTAILTVFSTIAGYAGGWFLIVWMRDTSSGQFLSGLDLLMEPADLLWLSVKGILYGTAVGLSACYWGSRAEGGPAGVASAVRRSILTSFPIVVFVGFIINQLAWGSNSVQL